MPPLKIYDLFISHAWFYSKGYNKLVELLNAANYFKWRNTAVPLTFTAAPVGWDWSSQAAEGRHAARPSGRAFQTD